MKKRWEQSHSIRFFLNIQRVPVYLLLQACISPSSLHLQKCYVLLKNCAAKRYMLEMHNLYLSINIQLPLQRILLCGMYHVAFSGETVEKETFQLWNKKKAQRKNGSKQMSRHGRHCKGHNFYGPLGLVFNPFRINLCC